MESYFANQVTVMSSFSSEPALTDELDYRKIRLYYANLREEGPIVSALLFIHHLENKIPKNHLCEFIPLIDDFHFRVKVDWAIYDECVAVILREIPIPSVLQFLRAEKKQLKASKSTQLNYLTASVKLYRTLYPNEPIPWRKLFKFFYDEFRASSLVVLQQREFRPLYMYITVNTSLEVSTNFETLWKSFSEELVERSSFCTVEENLALEKSSKMEKAPKAKLCPKCHGSKGPFSVPTI